MFVHRGVGGGTKVNKRTWVLCAAVCDMQSTEWDQGRGRKGWVDVSCSRGAVVKSTLYTLSLPTFTQFAHHIKCHPKPITLKWKWLIKPFHNKSAPMLTCCSLCKVFPTKVQCNDAYKHNCSSIFITTGRFCSISNQTHPSAEISSRAHLNVKCWIFKGIDAKTK